MFTQLHTPPPVHVVDKGAGTAFAVIGYGVEHHRPWVIALDEGGETSCASNPKVRIADDWTWGRARAPQDPAAKAGR